MDVTMMTACIQFNTSIDTRFVSVRLPRKYNVVDSNLLNRLKKTPERDVVLNEYWGTTYVSFLDRDRTTDLIAHYDSKPRSGFHNGVSFTVELMLNERKCKVSVRLFGNGKKSPNARAVIAGGMHDAAEVDVVSTLVTSLLTDITMYNVRAESIEISHIAAKRKLGFNLELAKAKEYLLIDAPHNVQIIYEPELHHGYMQVIFDSAENKIVTMHVHTKGTLMVMGMNSFVQMQEIKEYVNNADWSNCAKEEPVHNAQPEEDPDMAEFIAEIMDYDISADTYEKQSHEGRDSTLTDNSDILNELDEIMGSESHLVGKYCKQCSRATSNEFCSTSCARVYASTKRWKNAPKEKDENFYTDVQFHIRKMKRMMQLFPKDKFVQSMKSDRRGWMKALQECTCIEQLNDLARRFSEFMVEKVEIKNFHQMYEVCKKNKC